MLQTTVTSYSVIASNRMKTYGAIVEEIMNNKLLIHLLLPPNHMMKNVAKNNVFVFGENITAPQIFFFDYGEDKTAAQKKIFA